MSESATINLATVGTAELEAMSVKVFSACLDTMSGEAIARFRRMRKLSNSHRVALEKYLLDHPDKRPGGAGEAPPPAQKSGKEAATKNGKPARRAHFSEFKKRLLAWWEGIDVKDIEKAQADKPVAAHVPPPARKAPASVAQTKAPPAPAPDAPAPATDVEMLQKLWGEGFHLPGGEEFTMKLLEGVELPAGQPCLDVTAGLGGGVRAIADQCGIVVEGLESDAALAAAGHALSERGGMAATAPIRYADPMAAELPAKHYGAIFLRETLFTHEDRRKLLSHLIPSLRPAATLVLTDFVLADRKPGGQALQAWRAAEPQKPHPFTVDEYAELLDALRFNVRACDDLSTEYGAFIQAGWRRLHTCLQTAKLPPETAAILMNEGKVWLARSRALESGQLRLVSIKATLRAVKTASE